MVDESIFQHQTVGLDEVAAAHDAGIGARRRPRFFGQATLLDARDPCQRSRRHRAKPDQLA
jgi:hypothetical protein